jgi:hypothetical protein
MPRLLIFAPCEKVIIGQGDNNVSLIGILQTLNLTMSPAPGAPSPIPPSELVVPLSWTIFTMWQREVGEEVGTAYTQRAALISPSHKHVVEVVTNFTMEKGLHRIVNGVIGLPAGEAGTYTLRLWLRRAGSGDWNEVASFPLTVTHSSAVPTARIH